MQGCKDPFNRKYFPWWNIDKCTLEEYKKISKIRNSHSVYKNGKIKFISAQKNLVAFVRENTEEEMLTCVNISLNKINFNYNSKSYELSAMGYIITPV
jgi:glycosidase